MIYCIASLLQYCRTVNVIWAIDFKMELLKFLLALLSLSHWSDDIFWSRFTDRNKVLLLWLILFSIQTEMIFHYRYRTLWRWYLVFFIAQILPVAMKFSNICSFFLLINLILSFLHILRKREAINFFKLLL
jgi:hypothetical protein